MQNDLISRSALGIGKCKPEVFENKAYADGWNSAIAVIENAPAVAAVVLPIGRPGGYLEWDDGVGHRQIFRIHSIMICEDCMRYELSGFSPVVDHKGIVRILSPEDVETLVKERGKAWKYVWCEDDNKTEKGTEG